MSYARDIALATRTPVDAADAIRRRLAETTPDLTPGTGAWKAQADLLAGAVALVWRDEGITPGPGSTESADAIRKELGL